MDLLERFKSLLKSRYIFHLHTTYTDGLASVEDYCLWASKNEYNSVVFTEHVRRELSCEFDSFIKDIENAKLKFPNIDIWTGVEAKILPGGELDMPNEILPEIQVICLAFHSFPENIKLYEKSCKRVLSDSRWGDHIRVWVHPGYFLRHLHLIDNCLPLLDRLIWFAIEKRIFIEHNLRHKLPPAQVREKIPQTSLVVGLDAHSVEGTAVALQGLKE